VDTSTYYYWQICVRLYLDFDVLNAKIHLYKAFYKVIIFCNYRKRFFEPSVIVKVDTFSNRQERAKAALAKSPSQLKVLQRVRSSQQVEEAEKLCTLPEYDAAANDYSPLEPFVGDFEGGIEIMTKADFDQKLPE